MRIRHALLAAAAAIAAAGCGGNESCPTETPKVNDLQPSCVAHPGDTVSYPVQLCPTCNQTAITCDVQMSGGTIFLDPKAQACSSSSSCPPSCSPVTDACSFTAPAQGTYSVSVYDPATGETKTGTLFVDPAQAASCSI